MTNFMDIFREIEKASGTLRYMRTMLIRTQWRYAYEKCHTLVDLNRANVPTKGTEEQYKGIIAKLDRYERSGQANNIHQTLSPEEIELLLPDTCLEEDYSNILGEGYGEAY